MFFREKKTNKSFELIRSICLMMNNNSIIKDMSCMSKKEDVVILNSNDFLLKLKEIIII